MADVPSERPDPLLGGARMSSAECRICWGERIRTSNRLIQSQVIERTISFASFLVIRGIRRGAGPLSRRESGELSTGIGAEGLPHARDCGSSSRRSGGKPERFRRKLGDHGTLSLAAK